MYRGTSRGRRRTDAPRSRPQRRHRRRTYPSRAPPSRRRSIPPRPARRRRRRRHAWQLFSQRRDRPIPPPRGPAQHRPPPHLPVPSPRARPSPFLPTHRRYRCPRSPSRGAFYPSHPSPRRAPSPPRAHRRAAPRVAGPQPPRQAAAKRWRRSSRTGLLSRREARRPRVTAREPGRSRRRRRECVRESMWRTRRRQTAAAAC